VSWALVGVGVQLLVHHLLYTFIYIYSHNYFPYLFLSKQFYFNLSSTLLYCFFILSLIPLERGKVSKQQYGAEPPARLNYNKAETCFSTGHLIKPRLSCPDAHPRSGKQRVEKHLSNESQ